MADREREIVDHAPSCSARDRDEPEALAAPG
jgi:hypothetical protein